jgi:hypothetical protein
MAEPIVRRGSIVLIRYPFADLSGSKVRPALVLTPDHLLSRLEDVLCLFISSVMPEGLLPMDCVLETWACIVLSARWRTFRIIAVAVSTCLNPLAAVVRRRTAAHGESTICVVHRWRQ